MGYLLCYKYNSFKTNKFTILNKVTENENIFAVSIISIIVCSLYCVLLHFSCLYVVIFSPKSVLSKRKVLEIVNALPGFSRL